MMQIIVAALTAGCIAFLVVATVVAGVPGDSPERPFLTYVMLAIAATMVLARLIVPRNVVAQARRKIRSGTWPAAQGNRPKTFGDSAWQESDAGKLTVVLIMRTVIAAGILEGATFMLLIAYMVERSPLSLALAALLIVALAAHFPTVSSCSAWVDEQLRLLNEERAF
jgi:hypothetical protein